MYTILYLAVIAYVFIRGWQALPRIIVLRLIYSLIFIIALTSYISGVFFYKHLPEMLIIPVKIINRFWLTWIILFFTGALFADFLRIINHYLKIFPGWFISKYKKIKFIYLLFLLLSAIIISIVGFRQYNDPQIVKLNLKVPANCSSLEGLRIAVASDLHLAPMVDNKKLAEWVGIINSLQPDIVLLPGDIFSYNFHPRDSRGIIDEFRKLKSKYGVFAAPGNHDHAFGVEKFAEYLELSGITVLCDSSLSIDKRFILAGRFDFSNRIRKTLDEILGKPEPELPVILMDHQPADLQGATDKGVFLQVSGHTHNGQIFPLNYIYRLKWELVYGYRQIKNTHFYVSSGLGYVYIPIRIGSRSELVLIEIISDGPDAVNIQKF